MPASSTRMSTAGSSTPAHASQPLTLPPLKTADAPHDGCNVPPSIVPSRCSSISRTRDASPERQLSVETPQSKGLETTGCGSSNIEAPAYKAASGFLLGTWEALSPSSGPIIYCHFRRKAAYRLVYNSNKGDSNTDCDS